MGRVWRASAAAGPVAEQAVLSRVHAQAARLADTAALYQALGRGWWNRRDTET